LVGMTSTFWHNLMRFGQFDFHSKVQPHSEHASWIDVWGHSCQIVSTNSNIFVLHASWSFSEGTNFSINLSNHTYVALVLYSSSTGEYFGLNSLAALNIGRSGNRSFYTSMIFWTYSVAINLHSSSVRGL
jgi:hypothetical protein